LFYLDEYLLSSFSTNVNRHAHRLLSTKTENHSDEVLNKVVRELETKVQELEDEQSCSIYNSKIYTT